MAITPAATHLQARLSLAGLCHRSFMALSSRPIAERQALAILENCLGLSAMLDDHEPLTPGPGTRPV